MWRELVAIWYQAPPVVRIVGFVLLAAVIATIGTLIELARCDRDGYWNDDHPDREAGA